MLERENVIDKRDHRHRTASGIRVTPGRKSIDESFDDLAVSLGRRDVQGVEELHSCHRAVEPLASCQTPRFSHDALWFFDGKSFVSFSHRKMRKTKRK